MKNIVRTKNNNFPTILFSRNQRTYAFTMIELLVALMVSSVVLAAIVTLSYAMNSAYDSTSDINQKEAHIRYTTMRVSNLIKYSRLICKTSSNDFLIWRADENNDNIINVSEMMYIETGSGTYLRLLEFNPGSSIPDLPLELSFIQNYVYLKQWLLYWFPETYTTLISDCSNAEIQLDPEPPYTQFVDISFDIEENQQTRNCQISAALHCQMSGFINSSDNFINSDDDL